MVHAFDYCCVHDNAQIRIQTLDSWGERLVVTTAEGVIHIFHVTEKQANRDYVLDPAETSRTIFKKPVIHVMVVTAKAIDYLVALSAEGIFHVIRLPSLQVVFQSSKARGASFFDCKVEDNGRITLAAVVKKKISILILNSGDKDFNEIKEYALPDTPRTIKWCGNSICLGFKREYSMLNTSSGFITELFPMGKVGGPMITQLPTDEILLGKDNVSIFYGVDGKPTRKFGLSWGEIPQDIAYSYPYVLGALPKFLEVRRAEGPGMVQSVQIKAFRVLRTKGGAIFAASPSTIWRLLPVPLMRQIQQLASEREFEEALRLADKISKDSPEYKEIIDKVREIHWQYAIHLFQKRDYRNSMDHFLKSAVDPQYLLLLFPEVLPADLKPSIAQHSDLKGIVVEHNEYEKALEDLVAYLAAVRGSSQVNLSTVTRQQIDTALLHGYLLTNENLVMPFLRLSNHCHVAESEKMLNKLKKYPELILLYKGKNMHLKALQQLQKWGQVEGPLYGPDPTIKYLRDLAAENANLILDFSKWVLNSYPDKGIEIFKSEFPEDKPSVPRDQVIAHLQQYAPQHVVSYLEHIINFCGEKGSDFHNELINCYLQLYTRLPKDKSESEQVRRKLLAFLESSTHYSPEKMLSRFPQKDLFHERALLLSRIGRHEQALEIYAHHLQDPTKAVQYCESYYNPETEEGRDVYLSLLKVYLQPPGGKEPMIRPALALLDQHFCKIDTAKALEMLPPQTSISHLLPFFEAILREETKSRRENQIVRNIHKSENLHVRESLIRSRLPVVKVTEDLACSICKRRIWPSAFYRYPNGTVVHFGCCKDKHVCPRTGIDFSIVDN
eukprot:TRINITY_DN9805_c0_g1_i1.p1 TRINITY_DN9805_c0_g1~~TRINITY_DN9805_c0_g1_i1.p1  ORF type:complete len:839 (+),score=133.42 TRINITY_DN9805_c0_g1_i1:97-2613(+)